MSEINDNNSNADGPIPMSRFNLNEIEKMEEKPSHIVLDVPNTEPEVNTEEVVMPTDESYKALEYDADKLSGKVDTKAPINLAGLEEELDAEARNIAEPTVVEKPEEIKPEEIVTINVAEGEADKLIENLPLETYDKVVKSKVIKINEVELKDIPTQTTRITDIGKYRMLSKRRPTVASAEITERVLINSGFVVTLKAATSLEMATIFKSPTSRDVDYEKEYIFCYEHTVGTSLGKMSYNEFVSRVSPSDLDTILFGIYEISETDKRKVAIIDGRGNGGCGDSFEIDVEINKLPSYDSITDESKERIKTIIGAKNSIDETKRVVENSPTSMAKYIKLGDDRILTIRTTTGNMMIERFDRVDDIAETYGAIIAVLLLYVESITISYNEKEGSEPVNYLIDTMELLSEELLKLTDEELGFIKDIITDDLVEYPTIKYSIDGPIICPHCGNEIKSVPCNIPDLVFQKVQSVLA